MGGVGSLHAKLSAQGFCQGKDLLVEYLNAQQDSSCVLAPVVWTQTHDVLWLLLLVNSVSGGSA